MQDNYPVSEIMGKGSAPYAIYAISMSLHASFMREKTAPQADVGFFDEKRVFYQHFALALPYMENNAKFING